MKRCGKSAPRIRQRNRHGKPHREQDRIGTATRECSLQKSDNTAGRCQARRPGRLLEATCKRCPRGMAVTYRLPQAGGALQNPAYRPADVFENEGFGANTPDPSPIIRCFIRLFEYGDNSGDNNPPASLVSKQRPSIEARPFMAALKSDAPLSAMLALMCWMPTIPTIAVPSARVR